MTAHSDYSSPRLQMLRQKFGLSAFETDLVVLCAGRVLDANVASLIGGRPTFGYAYAHLAGAHLDASVPTRPLRGNRLLVLEPGVPALEAQLTIDDRILSYLLGVPTIDERLLPHILQASDAGPLTSEQLEVVDRLERALGATSWIQVHGGEQSTRLALLRAAASRRGLQLLVLRAGSLALVGAEAELLRRLVEREGRLGDWLPTLAIDPFDNADVARSVRAFADGITVPCAISAPDSIPISGAVASLAVPTTTAADRHNLWTSALHGRNFDFDRLAQQFQLEPGQITGLASTIDEATTFAMLWTACRDASRQPLDDLAQRIEPLATWESLVVAPNTLASLRDLISQLAKRHQVHERWGFARGDRRGQAITALFHGPSGTGKTHAAEVIARAAEVDLYHIDLSQVVDKYVGETEKRLRRIFDAAETGGAVLLFDEADALFGKRGNIERGTDRWANLEVSYLLQRMERYRGIAILTTNAKDMIDHAFLRRISFVVPFAFPEVSLRAELWRRVFPSDTPLAGIEPTKLAHLQLTGANIRSIAVRAAFHAARDRSSVTMAHLLLAARSEYAKLERPFPEAEVRSWEGRQA
ncbi:MAG: ATP-binding protein [Kofleriaceae bacterium]